MISQKLYPKQEARGTVLILCIVLLVILGLLASGFVIITLYERDSSRSLSRAEDIEQVRKMSLEYVRTLLLEDILGNDGKFLNGATPLDEAYDSPGTADPWMASRDRYQPDPVGQPDLWRWAYISNVAGGGADSNVTTTDLVDDVGTNTTGTDYNDDGVVNVDDGGDARWITTSGHPLADITTSNGTKYQVAIRIVDTNGLANINVGAANVDGSWPEANAALWDSRYPCDLDLRGIALGEANPEYLDSGGSVDGRIEYCPGTLFASLTGELYPYLANPNPGNTRSFDLAEEMALRMKAGPDEDLHGRLGTLWPATFGSSSDLLTAYSWTMQIRPPTDSSIGLDSEIDTALEALGYPAPCKTLLAGLVDTDDGTTENKPACTAVYLTLLAAGMDVNDAAQYMVNLVDYIDDDDGIRFIDGVGTTSNVIDFGTLPTGTEPTNIHYGTDNQPIISEVYSYRHYLGTPLGTVPETYSYTLNPNMNPATTEHRYAVELFNPSNQAISLNGWKLEVEGIDTHNLPSVSMPAGSFLTIVSDTNIDTAGAEATVASNLVITTNGGTQTIKLSRRDPSDSSDVVVDRFEDDFEPNPPPNGSTATAARIEYSERPGRLIPPDKAPSTDYVPVIAEFSDVAEIAVDAHTLGTYSKTAIAAGEGGQIVLNNTGELHSLGELFYVPKIANNGTEANLIEEIEGQSNGDSNYRLSFADTFQNAQIALKVLQNLTLRTGVKDGVDNDGEGNSDVAFNAGVLIPSSILEARVPGLININTAPNGVLEALHYYYIPNTYDLPAFVVANRPFTSIGDIADKLDSGVPATNSEDESDPADGGSADGIDVDNEEKLFHFKNVANLISVRSDVFVVYIAVQAIDRDGDFTTLRTMAIVDRSFCLRPDGTLLADIPLPRILAQTTLP